MPKKKLPAHKVVSEPEILDAKPRLIPYSPSRDLNVPGQRHFVELADQFLGMKKPELPLRKKRGKPATPPAI